VTLDVDATGAEHDGMPPLLGPVASAVLATLFAAPAGLQTRPPAGATVTARPAQVRAQVESYLDSIDTPVRPEQWRALGPDAATLLEAIAQDPRKLPTRRARALSALVVVGSPRASRLVVTLAQRESEKSVVRMSALRAAGDLLDPTGLVAAVKPVLEGARDTRVRAAAAGVLALRSPKEGCPSVRTQSAREKSETRPTFARALQACDTALSLPRSQ
jgi:HEAT repeat protein